jgi:hypothetical protein
MHKILNSWVVLLLIIHSFVRFSSLVTLSALSCPQDNVKNLHLSVPDPPLQGREKEQLLLLERL